MPRLLLAMLKNRLLGRGAAPTPRPA